MTKPAAPFNADLVTITRKRFSVTQGEVLVEYDGQRIEQFGDAIKLDESGEYHGHDDAFWIGVAKREAIVRGLAVEPTPPTPSETAIAIEMHGDNSAIASWTDNSGHRCHAWIYADDNAKVVMPETFYVNPALDAFGKVIKTTAPGYFSTRTRDLTAKANRKIAEALRTAILVFDMPAAREACAEARRQKRAEEVRESRRRDIAEAVATIRGADADEVASASLDLPPDVAAAVMRLAHYRT